MRSKTADTKIRNVVRRLGQATINQLVADYEGGAETTTLTNSYGLSKSSVIELLENNGVVLRRQPLTEDQVAEAIWLYEHNHSLTSITEKLGLPRESIRRALVGAGVVMRARGGARTQSRR